jgi:hypothetical protein
LVASTASEQSGHHAADQANRAANAVMASAIAVVSATLHAAPRCPVRSGLLVGFLSGINRGRFDGS